MKPIINPWLFYMIDAANFLKIGAVLFGLVVGVVLILIGVTSSESVFSTEAEKKSAKRKTKIGIIVCAIGIALFVFAPSSETLMKMYIAQNVTYDDVDAEEDVILHIYNDILALSKIKEG